MVQREIAQLTEYDIDAILSLERVCYMPCLQASRETLQKRFDLGHVMLGLFVDNKLTGVASFSYRYLDGREKIRQFCENEWKPFYALAMPETFNTVLVYNVEISPERRETNDSELLKKSVMSRAKNDGCKYLIGISRIPSYNGDVFNHISHRPEVREAIDSYFDGGEYPSLDTLIRDPLLLFYHRVTGCEYLTLIDGYAPEDKASGGIRAIVYAKL